MERKIAEKLMKIFNSLGDPLNEASLQIEQISDDKEKKVLRRGLAEIMGRIFTDLEIPIIREYPDLDPDKDTEWLKALKNKSAGKNP